jgi:hypothetical protein
MLRAAHLPAIDVRVNGRGPFRFAIDTGGGGSARIDSALAARLGLPVVGKARAGDPSGQNLREMTLVSVDSIEFGGARFAGLTAAVRDYNEGPRKAGRVDGVLGFGLFAECLLTLDYPAGRVRVARDTLPPENGRDILAYRGDRGIASVTLRIDSLEVDADIDAGSPGGFTLPGSLRDRVPLATAPRVVGRGRTVSNSFEIEAARLRGEVRLGGFAYPEPEVEFVPIFPVGNVGERVLRDFRITFDQRNRRLRLEKTGS